MRRLIEKRLPISLFVLVIPSVYFLVKRGFYEPHDLHHVADIYQMYRAIVSGQFPPRWGPDFLYGFGYPLFNFYYLFPFYIGAFLFAITNSLQFSFEAVFIISVLISVFGMFLFLREFVGKWAAFVGSALFIYTPYRAVQIYVRGAMGEAFSLALMPLIAWVLVLLGKKPKNLKVVFASSFLLAIFIISHNYFWFLALPWILIFVVVLYKNNYKIVLPALFKVNLFAFGLTAYWWLPAIVENRLVTSVTPFPLIDHFPFIRQLILPSWGYGSSIWGPGDEISFQIGLVNLIAITVFGLLVLMERKINLSKRAKLLVIWSFVSFSLAAFFMNIRSYPLWKILPFYNFIQFPWRLLFLTTFFSSVIAAVLVEVFKKRREIIGWVIILSCVIFTVGYFKPSGIVFREDNDYLHRFFANRSIEGETQDMSVEYQLYSEDYLLLPNWAETKPDYLPDEIFESKTLKLGEVQKLSPVSYTLLVDGGGGELVVNILNFPGWVAYIDGIVSSTYTIGRYGKIGLLIPPGRHDVKISWEETGIRLIADYVTAGTLLYIGYVYILKRRKPDEKVS